MSFRLVSKSVTLNDLERNNGLYVDWAEAYLRTKWCSDPFSRLAAIDMGRKMRGCSAHFAGGGELSNRMWPGLPLYQLSGILIHPAV